MFRVTWEEALRLVREHEKSANVKYVYFKQEARWEKVCAANPGNPELFFSKKKVMFETSSKQVRGKKIEYDGIPYIMVGQTIMQCHHGTVKTKCKKPANSANDHDFSKSRIGFQYSKKIGCSAMVVLTEVLKYPEYSIKTDSKTNRKAASKRLRERLQHDPRKVKMERRIYTDIPPVEAHLGHPVGEEEWQSLPRHYRENAFITFDMDVVIGKTQRIIETDRPLTSSTETEPDLIDELAGDNEILLTTEQQEPDKGTDTAQIDLQKKVVELRELARSIVDGTYRIEKMDDIQDKINMMESINTAVINSALKDNELPLQSRLPGKHLSQAGVKRNNSLCDESKHKFLPLPKRPKKPSASLRVGKHET